MRTSASLNDCMQRQKWSRQPTVVGASRQISPSRRCVLSLLEQVRCSSITRIGIGGAVMQYNLLKVAFVLSEAI